jgi:thiol:disulfide interchange protein
LIAWAFVAPVAAQDFGFGLGKKPAPAERVKLSAVLRPVPASSRAVLEVTALIAPGHHVYSTEQIAPGKPSVIKVPESPSYRLLGKFKADKAPTVKDPDPDLGIVTESFKGKVTWRAALEFADGVDVATQTLKVDYAGLVCEATGSCFPISGLTATATVGDAIAEIDPELIQAAATPAAATPAAGQVKVVALSDVTELEEGFVKVSGRLSHARLQPGDSASLFLMADVAPGNHTYPNLPATETPAEAYLPTYMGVLSVAPAGNVADFKFTQPMADQVPHDHFSGDATESVPALDGTVQWEIKFQVPSDLLPGEYRITGVMQVQTCDEFSCQPPVSLAWQVPLVIGSTTEATPAAAVLKKIAKSAQRLLTQPTDAAAFLESIGISSAVAVSAADGPPLPGGEVVPTRPLPDSPAAGLPEMASEAGGPILDLSQLKPDVKFDPQSLSIPMVILLSLFGGFVLNFMPCVLPVIGLKILSLVEQAGESRIQALKFNGTYVLGMLSVFWVLAALIAGNQIAGWGSQFSNTLFTIVFSGVIFAMALSYLEVWEIVLPSAVGQHSAKLEQKEGLAGTFFKGGVTTILATPCSGPGLATALAWCADKEAPYVFLVFTCLGLGMGLPYLAVALYPPIISFLPKPGAWMLTFKQVMGFVLLGTVAFFLSYIDLPYLFPTFCFLMVIWFGCWLVGRLTFLSSTRTWIATWAAAVLTVLAGSHLIYGWKLSPESNRWLTEKVLPFDWNTRLANDWNLFDAQAYRLNTFVDRQVAYRRTQPKETKPAHKIDWVPFSLADLQRRLHGDRPETILIDFTADWCMNCKAFERTVLHSSDVEKRLISEHVTTVIADKTLDRPDIDAMLNQLTGSVAIPVYAIFSKDRPNEPIVLDGTTISIANVQAALDKAGVPSASQIQVAPAAGTQAAGTQAAGTQAAGTQAGGTQAASDTKPLASDPPPQPPRSEVETTRVGREWLPFDLAELETMVQRKPAGTMLIQFTADWDMNAAVFSRVVLEHSEIDARLSDPNVLKRRADLTSDAPALSAQMREWAGAQASAPVYVVLALDGRFPPLVLDGRTMSVPNLHAALDRAGVPTIAQLAGGQERGQVVTPAAHRQPAPAERP